MPRAPRTDVGGLVYHVLNRANARAPLFDDEIDYCRFTELLAEERARSGMRPRLGSGSASATPLRW